MKKPLPIAFTAILAVVTVLLVGAGSDDTVPDSTLTAQVEKGDLPIEVDLSGTFVADNKDEIRMEPKKYRGDLIITKLVPEGRSVKKGDPLIEFDPSNLEDSLDEAGDEVKAKQVEVDKASADLEAWKIDFGRKNSRREVEATNALKDLNKEKEQTAFTLVDKQQGITDSENRLKDTEVDLEQLLQLYEERELHTSNENILIDRERRRLESAQRGHKKTLQEFELWKKYDQNREVESKQLDYDDKVAEVKKAAIQADADRKEKEATLAKAERALKKAQEKVDELTTDAGTLEVVSPRDGVVFYGSLGTDDGPNDIIIMGMGGGNDEMKVGGRVRTFQVLMTVASMDKLSIRMKAQEGDIQHLKTGLPVAIRPDAFPVLAIEGELTKVDQVASRTGFLSSVREFTVRGSYEGSYPQLRSGMNCRVTVRANSIKDCVNIPILAVFSEGNSHFCWLVDGGKKVKQPIEIGPSNGSKVQIKSGLRPGQTIALYDPSAA